VQISRRRKRQESGGFVVLTGFVISPPGRGANYCDEYVCLSVRLSASITRKPHGRISPILVGLSLWPWLSPALITLPR